jgi:hypothetical protein
LVSQLDERSLETHVAGATVDRRDERHGLVGAMLRDELSRSIERVVDIRRGRA